MTSKERMERILDHKPVDRIAIFEHYWNDTEKAWKEQGHLAPDERVERHFHYDISENWAFNFVADPTFTPQVLEETEETILQLDGNGARLRRHKLHDSTPEHVGFTVTDRAGWEELIKPKLLDLSIPRTDYAAYRAERQYAREHDQYFVWSGVNVFECMHPVCGHENLLIGMIDDPDWILDMTNTYSDLILRLWEDLFAKEGWPDGIWFYEDMGFKGRPFMSPDMYRELIYPAHKKTMDFAHAYGMKVIMHSCGFVEPLLPYMIEAGIDCLQAIEVKSGMDLLRIHKNFGEKIALMGGIDVRALYSNDKAVIDQELLSKIPVVKQGYGYIAHSDHSIPKTVDYDTYLYFYDRALSLGQY